jgi:hypothetical protein
MAENGFEQIDRDPVVCMRVKDVRAYVDWLNKKLDSGKNSGIQIYIAHRAKPSGSMQPEPGQRLRDGGETR